jgi:hypothetical protein
MVPTRPKIKSVEWTLNKKIHRLAIPSQHTLAVLPREFGLGDLELHVRMIGVFLCLPTTHYILSTATLTTICYPDYNMLPGPT